MARAAKRRLAKPFGSMGAMRAMTWQDSVGRYIDGGIALLLQTLAALEERFAFLERVHAAATVRAQVVDFTEQFGQKYATTFATQITESRIIDNPFAFGKMMQGLQVYGFNIIKPQLLGVDFIKNA